MALKKKKLVKRRKPSMESVKVRIEKLTIPLQNKFALLNEEENGVYRLNDTLTMPITESSGAVEKKHIENTLEIEGRKRSN